MEMPVLGESHSERAARYAHLKPYHFKKGDPNNPAKINPLAHRQKGMKLAQTIYMSALPLKAQQWVKDTSPATLIDARKISWPQEIDGAERGPQLVVFLGDQSHTSPR